MTWSMWHIEKVLYTQDSSCVRICTQNPWPEVTIATSAESSAAYTARVIVSSPLVLDGKAGIQWQHYRNKALRNSEGVFCWGTVGERRRSLSSAVCDRGQSCATSVYTVFGRTRGNMEKLFAGSYCLQLHSKHGRKEKRGSCVISIPEFGQQSSRVLINAICLCLLLLPERTRLEGLVHVVSWDRLSWKWRRELDSGSINDWQWVNAWHARRSQLGFISYGYLFEILMSAAFSSLPPV